MNIELLFKPCRTSDLARIACKRIYGKREIFTGDVTPWLDAAHIYDAGKTRYKHLAKLPGNIVPMTHARHIEFDKLSIGSKISLLRTSAHDDFKAYISIVLDRLESML